MNKLNSLVNQLYHLAKQSHYYCEDSWYSCPKAEGGCANKSIGSECDCGADVHNKKVEKINRKICEYMRSNSP